MPAEIMTVTGPISADELGFTLPHEHIFLDLMRDAWVGPNFLADPELAQIELQRYRDAGGTTLVDLTSGGLENDQDLIFDDELNHVKHPIAVRDIARRTGINVKSELPLWVLTTCRARQFVCLSRDRSSRTRTTSGW